MRIRMLIIDDEYYIRLGIVNAFDWESMGIEIVGEAQDGEEGFLIAMREKPDLILMDICMPFLNGLELMEKIRSENLNCEIIVLSGYDEFEYAQTSIRHGVLDYLLKPIDKEKLKETVAKACLRIQKRRSLESCRHIVEAEQDSIQTQFIRNLLFGNLVDEESIRSKISLLNLPLIDRDVQLIVVKIDEYTLLEKQKDLNQLSELKGTLFDLMQSQFLSGEGCTGMITSTSSDEWVVVLSYTKPWDYEEQYKTLRRSVEQFLSEVETRIENTVSLSISPVSDNLEQLAELYKNARQDNKKFLPKTNSVIWPENDAEKELRPEILDIINFVKNHYNEPITVEQVAGACYISPSYLMHLFKSNVGKTFNTFLLEYRMERAKELLEKPGIQIQTVSTQVGYTDVKYFCKLFKKYTHLTPSDYVRMHYAKH